MKEYVLPSLLYQPMLSLWLLVVACALWRRARAARVLVLSAMGLLLAAASPLAGKAAARVLVSRALSYEDAIGRGAGRYDLVLVPTGGSFVDPVGGVWPARPSIDRATLGLSAARALGLPLLVSGGVTSETFRGMAEATAVAAALHPGDVRLVLEEQALDSCGTARNLARVLAANGLPERPRILLVTSPLHLRRMGACLSAQGYGWEGLAAGEPRHVRLVLPRDALPTASAITLANGVAYEVLGIAAYLATGRIRLRDLL